MKCDIFISESLYFTDATFVVTRYIRWSALVKSLFNGQGTEDSVAGRVSGSDFNSEIGRSSHVRPLRIRPLFLFPNFPMGVEYEPSSRIELGEVPVTASSGAQLPHCLK